MGSVARRVRGVGTSSRGQAGLALGLYAAISIAYFGLPVLGHLRTSYIGSGQDPQIFIWALRWWPYAISHGMDPFYTHVVWAPVGDDVTWTSSVPGASLLALPITETVGPTAAWNVLCLTAPASAAWVAFLLCRRLTRSFAASLAGGFAFGYSSYELATMQAHLHLSLVFLVALVAYLLVRRLQGDLGERRLVALLTVALTLQFMLSPEIFATACGFGALALGLAWLLEVAERAQIVGLMRPLTFALSATAVLVSPLVVHMLTHVPPMVLNLPAAYSADLVNFVIPTPVTALGGQHLASFSHAIAPGASGGDISEKPAYLGIPLLIILCVFAVRRWRAASTKLLVAIVLVSALTSLGPILHVDGHQVSWSPGALLADLPVLANLLPARLIMFGDLAVAVMLALWLSPGPRRRAKWIVSALAIISLLPSGSFDGWHHTPFAARFVASGSYRRAIGRHDAVMTLPFAYRTDGMWAQAEADMYFRLVGGALQPTPSAYAQFPIFTSLTSPTHIDHAGFELRRFLDAESVAEIVVDRSQLAKWQWLLSTLHLTPQTFADVLVYRVAGSVKQSAP